MINNTSRAQGKLTYVPPPAGEDDEEEKQPDTYEGDMEHGVRQGSGTYKWSNGTLYVGSYVAGKKHGRGKLTFPDKSVYEGALTHTRPMHAGARLSCGHFGTCATQPALTSLHALQGCKRHAQRAQAGG